MSRFDCEVSMRALRAGVETVKRVDYRNLHPNELQNEIRKMLSQIEGGLGRVDAEMRAQLLPALELLRRQLHRGQWEKFLRNHKLNPATVRKWRARERVTTTSLLELLGEPPRRKKPAARAEQMSESAVRQLAEAGKRLAEVVLERNWKYATKLAAHYLGAWADAA